MCRAAIARKLDSQIKAYRLRYGVPEADAARGRHDLVAAIEGYDTYLHRCPRDIGIRMRKARVHLAAGQFHLAEQALLDVLRRRPGKPEAQSELALVRQAVSRRPESLAKLALVDREEEAWRFASPAYDAFRQSLIIPKAPDGSRSATTIVIDARDSDLQSLRACLLAISGLEGTWRAFVLSPDGRRSALATDLGHLDRRIALISADALPTGALDGSVMLLSAEAVLAPEALDWLAFTLSRTGARAVYADHDRAIMGPTGLRYFAPALQGAAHREDLATNVRPPIAVLFASSASSFSAWIGPVGGAVEHRRARTIAAFEEGVVAHVPLLLATAMEEGEVEQIAMAPRQGPDWAELPEGGYPSPSATTDSSLAIAQLLVVVPTRDEALSLQVMVDSLLSLADDPARLRILVVDNGSSEPQTARILQSWLDQGRAEILRIDEPFNWSRLNNLAVAGRTEDAFLFINNDMEMLTQGWDTRLLATLSRSGMGVVGARLFYPTGSVQHAGMALNGLDGAPLHEGLGASADETGPLDRWIRPRPAAAVTGAFMAVRRETFVAVGGFDEINLPISCSDVDFCMRVRALRLTVFFDGEMELIHFESRTRGHADTEAKVRRALAELNSLRATWGEALLRDPGRNPHWLGHNTRLFQWVRCPGVAEIIASIDRAGDAWSTAD